MKFTIYGGSGYIGSHLSLYLKNLGHEVSLPGKLETNEGSENLGHVIYAVGLTGNFRNSPFQTIDAHVTYLAELMRESEFESWLYLSSTRIYLNSRSTVESGAVPILPGADSIYDISKLLGESLCLSIKNPQVRVARLSNVIGEGQSQHTFFGSLLLDVRDGRKLEIKEHLESAKDYITISDVVRILVAIATVGRHRVYNVASGRSTTHSEIKTIIERVSGRPVSVQDSGPTRLFPTINIQRIRDEFGFVPRDTLSEIEGLLQI